MSERTEANKARDLELRMLAASRLEAVARRLRAGEDHPEIDGVSWLGFGAEENFPAGLGAWLARSIAEREIEREREAGWAEGEWHGDTCRIGWGVQVKVEHAVAEQLDPVRVEDEEGVERETGEHYTDFNLEPNSDAPETGRRFFLLSLKHGCVGNCALWWGRNSSGYVLDLERAGLYSAEDAHRLADGFDTFAIAEGDARAMAGAHVDYDHEQLRAYKGQRRARENEEETERRRREPAWCKCGHSEDAHSIDYGWCEASKKCLCLDFELGDSEGTANEPGRRGPS